jgi:CheY-like chemotaxis protein
LAPEAQPLPRVLVVDDDQVMVTLLRTLLQLDGFEVIGAHPHESVVEVARVGQPDLILMDVFLRGSDGLEILAQLKANPDLARIPVVMCSGMDMSDACMQRGAQAFLTKPYAPDHLIDTIRASLAQPGSPKGMK